MKLVKYEQRSKLNPAIFDDNEHMKPEVCETLLKIVNEFVDYIDNYLIEIDIKDIVLVGSNAAYNYSDKSDIDLHVVADVKNNDCNAKHLALLYDLFKSNFNDKYDISIDNFPVEIYVESDKVGANSNGIYSVESDKWLKKPEKKDIIVDLDDVKEKFNALETRYLDALHVEDLDAVSKVLDDIYELRQSSIIDGEFSVGNLVFKKFRDKGYISEIKKLIDHLRSEELSLD